jgi:chorismate synthase
MGNSIGKIFRFTSFGESHGPAIGGIIDGCPAGMNIDLQFIQSELDRRRPGQSNITSPRNEMDKVEFLSGIYEGKTLGTPIGFIIRNKDVKSEDYDHLKDIYRPSHADYTYQKKYGIRDHRGGGRQSARETATRVVAGAIAKQILAVNDIEIIAYTSQVGSIKMTDFQNVNQKDVEGNIVRCPDKNIALKMIKYIEQLKTSGDSVGGVINCEIRNPEIGLGEPVFDKLHADLGKAMLSINAVKGFDYGSGFNGLSLTGSELNDAFRSENNETSLMTNNSGGIQGGISNGENINFRVAFKPVATINLEQKTVDAKGNDIVLKAKGRHDPCVLPRAVPIVEAMAAIVVLDHILLSKTITA